MTLTLHYHPLSSFCWKTLIALYENDTPFTPNMVGLGNEAERAALLKLSPTGRFPVLQDDARGEIVPESSIIVEYLGQHYPGPTQFIPGDADLERLARLRDRFYDLYLHLPVQKIVGDRIRPADKKDPYGVEQARAQLRMSYNIIEEQMAAGGWATGETFGLADCAAAPSLFYANKVEPFGSAHKSLTAYFGRLKARRSFARVLSEAEPYFKMFPEETATSQASKAEIIRNIFAAYLSNDRKAVEDSLTGDFRFTSPYDDAIDKPTYFERCWRNSDWIERHELEKVFVEGDEAFVTYKCIAKDGKNFRNTEFFTFADDKVKRIDVYFGASYKGGLFVRQQG